MMYDMLLFYLYKALSLSLSRWVATSSICSFVADSHDLEFAAGFLEHRNQRFFRGVPLLLFSLQLPL